ncbi:hypothetical protein [Microcoleus sp. OTE_8_concoct_300]|uniref:hypothetical protein n=1 Tax=Microcoleus sp. OTE_8_concoct_300 TaxID=2964710 RepID=UPI00403FB922
MKIRESQGKSIWNHSQVWCCEPLDPIPPGHIALAVEAIALDIVDWDIEEIGEKAGFDIQYRYTGVNDPKDSSLACVTQFVGIYEDWSKLDRPFCPKVRSTLFSQITKRAIALPLQI